MNESLGKWAKNVFTKFGKKSVEKEFLKTFNSFRKKYKLNRISEDKPNYFGKIEDGYIILIKFDQLSFKNAYLLLSLLSKKSLKPVHGIKNIAVEIKHSYTEEEIADAINDELQYVHIELSTASGNIPPELLNKQNSQPQQSVTDNTDKLNKIANAAGFETKVFQEKLN
jgi:hypothetical protein